MKTYEITLKHDNGNAVFRLRADSISEAQTALLEMEKAPPSAVVCWRVVPTKKQIAKTKNLMRGI